MVATKSAPSRTGIASVSAAPAFSRTLYQVAMMFALWMLFTGGVCEMVPDSEPITPEDLYGAYGATFQAGVIDSLFLYPDSTYVRTYRTYDGTQYSDTGRWSLSYMNPANPDAKRQVISFPDFIARFDIDSASPNTPFWGAVGIPDSVAALRSAGLFKRTVGNHLHIQFGQRYGAAYVKEGRRDR